MTLHTSTQIPAGWYPDPQGSFQQRWWDGSAWTNEFAQYRPTLNYTPQTRAAAVNDPIPVYAPAVANPLSPPAPRADLLNAAPAAVQVPVQTPAQPPPPPADYVAPLAIPVQVESPPVQVDSPPTQEPAVSTARHVRSTEPDSPAVVSAAAVAPKETSAVAPEASGPSPSTGRPTRRYTAAGWLLALVPGLAAAAAVGIATFLPNYYTLGTVGIVGAITLVVLIALGYLDSARLRRDGHQSRVPGIVAVFGPLYFLARSIVVTRQTGGPAIGLLILSLLVCGAIAAAYFLVPGLATLALTLKG